MNKHLLNAEKETNEMMVKEQEIENLIRHIEIELTEYDLKYCNTKQLPVPFLTVIQSLTKAFCFMKVSARSPKTIWVSDEANIYRDFINKKVNP